MTITLPHNYSPRTYQTPFLSAMDRGLLRAVLVWHRRAGKDKTLLNFTVKKMFERVGVYFYLFPTYAQGKKIIWDGVDGDGFRFLSHFPPEIIESKNDTEMKVKTRNGSVFQIIGTDNYDSIMGTNPVGCVFSEYALQDPRAWDYIRPILRENGGWAVFNFTPRGKNHGNDLFEMARENPEWFCQRLTVDDTIRPDGSPVLSREDMDKERAEGMDEELIRQEYYCSFDMGVQGAYFFKQIQTAEEDGRVTGVPYDSRLEVDTWWDLGKIGEYNKRLLWNRLGYSRDRVFELTISEPVKKVVIGANLEVSEGR